VLLDVDTGIDDSLALLYACASPEVDLIAVTCTAGNVDARQVTENTRAVLELAGRPDVEVALGRETPLVRPLVTTPETHGPCGIGYATLPPSRARLSARHGADVIVEEARRRPGRLTVVCIAPLTNLAVAVARAPDLPLLVGKLVIMGGSFRTPGNTAPTTEWNASVDPHAVKAVYTAFGAPEVQAARAARGLPPRPVALGLDVTERAKLVPAHLEGLAARAGCAPDGTRPDGSVNAVVRYIADSLRFYMEFHSRYDGFYGAFIHDPFALATAVDPSLVRTQPVPADVELEGTLTAGETVADWRRAWRRPDTLDVGVEADAETFFERFVERVGTLAAERG
jgi:purine nucleosidase